jgi:hypothetical protein
MGYTLTRVRRLKVFERVAAWIVLSDSQKRLHLRMGLPEQTLHIVRHFLSVERERPSEVPEDGYALAAACDILFANHALAQRMGHSGFMRIKQHYHRELWLERIKQVYAGCGVKL